MRISDWSSDVCSSDLPILIFDPETLPRRSRDDPGEAAVRIARRMTEILSARTGDGHVLRVDLRLRPHPEVTPIVLPVNAAISYYESDDRKSTRLNSSHHCAYSMPSSACTKNKH